jgi:peptidoglycan/LPS O-acetylase OafA/YrhL
MVQKLTYEPGLDGLRAVAVGMVVASHLFPRELPVGWIGVHLFFVLSGYLITRLLIQEIDEGGTIQLGRFYLRRALRLMPPLWLMLLMFLPFILLGHHRAQQFESWAMAATYLMNLNVTFGWLGGPNEAFGHTWSLATEEQFYLLWPAALLLGARRHPRLILLSLLIASVAWRAYLSRHGASFDRLYYSPDTDSDALIIGCLLAFWRVPDAWRHRLASIWPLWLLALSAAILYFSAAATFGVDLVALLGALLIITTRSSSLGEFLSAKPLPFIGKISYSLYLWHLPLIEFMRARWHLVGWQLLIPVAASFGAAVFSYYTVEAWARRMKNKSRAGQNFRQVKAAYGLNSPASNGLP